MIADVNQRLRDFLVAAFPAWSVYASATFPEPGYDPETTAAVVFKTRGGQFTEENDHLVPSFQLKIYGSDAADAWANYMALDQALVQPVGEIVWAIPEGIGSPVVEPQTAWHFVLAFYQIVVRND